jgi:hypothetical protein
MLASCAVAAVAAVVISAPATATPPLSSTLSGTITSGGGWCCGGYATIDGVATLPGIGRVSFEANWMAGHDPYAEPMTAFTTESVVLTAMNGDSLALAGGSDAQDEGGLSVPWSVVGGTGRFNSFSGSGAFSFHIDWGTSTGTIGLTGTLVR